MDRIEITGLRVFGRHGVFPEERRDGQHFVVDLVLEVDLAAAAASDALAETVDYATLAERVAELVAGEPCDLVETVAGRIAALALQDPRVQAVEVRVGKPEVALGLDLVDVAVRLRRERSG